MALSAIDTSILLDVLSNDPEHGQSSLELLQEARDRGALIVCPVVWAEIASFFRDTEAMRNALTAAGIRYDPFDQACAEMAGAMWAEHRSSGGPRTRVIADFLIGAHAQVREATLLTRDRGYYRQYFSRLKLAGT